MMVSIQIAVVVLLALLIGVVIPVVLSLRSLAKRAEKSLDHLDEQMTRVLQRTTDVLDRADKVGGEFQESLPRLTLAMARIEKFSQSLDVMRKHMRTASTIGAAAAPAVISAIQALRAQGGQRCRQQDWDEQEHGEHQDDRERRERRDDCDPEPFRGETADEEIPRKKEAKR